MQSQGLNSNYLYQLMHRNNGGEIPTEDNSRTEPNSSQETAPVRCQVLVPGCPAQWYWEGDHSLCRKETASSQLWASIHFQPLQEVEPLLQPTPNQLLSSWAESSSHSCTYNLQPRKETYVPARCPSVHVSSWYRHQSGYGITNPTR